MSCTYCTEIPSSVMTNRAFCSPVLMRLTQNVRSRQQQRVERFAEHRPALQTTKLASAPTSETWHAFLRISNNQRLVVVVTQYFEISKSSLKKYLETVPFWKFQVLVVYKFTMYVVSVGIIVRAFLDIIYCIIVRKKSCRTVLCCTVSIYRDIVIRLFRHDILRYFDAIMCTTAYWLEITA